jgi:hypothetical protein
MREFLPTEEKGTNLGCVFFWCLTCSTGQGGRGGRGHGIPLGFLFLGFCDATQSKW